MAKQKLTVSELEAELKNLYEQKRRARADYSVRAFAADLGAHASTLQKVMRGERKLGFRVAQEIAARLNAEVVRTKSRKVTRTKGWKLALDSESYTQISWLNLAILEMIKLKDFTPSTEWVSRRLGVPEDVVLGAIELMGKEKMLLRRDDGVWVDLLKDASSGAYGFRSTEAIRTRMKEVMDISKTKIDAIPFERREHGCSILPVAKNQLPALKKRIQQFQWELCEFAQNANQPKEDIYTLHVGFFPITESRATV